MSYIIAEKFPHPILENAETPLVSIYLPTTRINTGSKDNEIRFKNALKKVEVQLKENYPGEGDKILSSLEEMLVDKAFWNEQYDGVAILASKNNIIVYKLQRDVKEYAEVSDTFYIVPLLNAYQTDDSFQILVLTQNAFRLYEGNRYSLREVSIPEDEHKGLKDVVGYFYEEPGRNQKSMGTSGRATFGTGGSADDEDQIDIEKYFRWIDRYIIDNHSKRTEVPLILAALPENFTKFQDVTHNDYLEKNGIKKDAQSLDVNELRHLAWNVLEPSHMKTLKDLEERFELSKSRELASDDLSEIAQAALEGRIEVLLIPLGKTVPGKINSSTAKIEHGKDQGDMLNDVALMAISQNAKVYVVQEDELKIGEKANAIYRYLKA